MSKFVQLSDDQQDLGTGPQFREDSHESMSLASEDLELGRIEGNSSGTKTAIKNYIKEKKTKIAQFDVKAFAESKRDEIQSFSLEEFMTGKRKVLIRACLGELVVTTLFLVSMGYFNNYN
jgi:DNA replication protein DnaD